MPFTVQLSGFTLGVSILNVDLYGCTGTTSACTGGTINDLTNYFQISGHTNIGRNDLNGRFVVVPDDIKTIKVVPSNSGKIVWQMGPMMFSHNDSRPSEGGHDEDWRDNVLPAQAEFKREQSDFINVRVKLHDNSKRMEKEIKFLYQCIRV